MEGMILAAVVASVATGAAVLVGALAGARNVVHKLDTMHEARLNVERGWLPIRMRSAEALLALGRIKVDRRGVWLDGVQQPDLLTATNKAVGVEGHTTAQQ